MPNCCGGGTCSCQIIGEGRIDIEGSGQPTNPFVISVEAAFAPTTNETFETLTDGDGTAADPWTIETVFAPTARLDHIPDVNAPAPANGQVLTWNSATSRWVATAGTTAPTGAVSHDTSLTGDGSAGLPLAVAPDGTRYIGSLAAGVGLSDQGMLSVVHHFTNEASRTSVIPTPVTNMLTMLDTDPGVVEYWDGVSWLPLPSQNSWAATEALLELSGGYTTGIPVAVVVVQVETTTDGSGAFDVLTPTDLAGRSGVLTVSVQEIGSIGWAAVIYPNNDRISALAYRLSDGSVMAGTPVSATIQAVAY